MARKIEAYELGSGRDAMRFLDRAKEAGLEVYVGSADHHTIKSKKGVKLGYITGQLSSCLIIRDDIDERQASGLRKLVEDFH